MTNLLLVAILIVAVSILIIVLRGKSPAATAPSIKGVVPEIEFQRALGRLTKEDWQQVTDGDFDPLRSKLNVIDPPPKEIVKTVTVEAELPTSIANVVESLETAYRQYQQQLGRGNNGNATGTYKQILILEERRDNLIANSGLTFRR